MRMDSTHNTKTGFFDILSPSFLLFSYQVYLWFPLGNIGNENIVRHQILDEVCEHTNGNWRRSTKTLGLRLPRSNKSRKSAKEKVNDAFKAAKHAISWNDLQSALIKIKRNDVIERVKQHRCITVGKCFV